MQVPKNEWLGKALDNINVYLVNRGDEGLELYGNDLRNTIGFAMGLPITVPKSENDIEEAIKGTFCFYSGKAFDAINKIAVRIAEFSPPPPAKRLVTVVPIELYYEGWLYELPVFRTVDILDPTKTTATTTTTTTTNNTRFIDNCGRVYKDFTDFRLNNKMFFPEGGHLKPTESNPQRAVCACSTTPANRVSAKILKYTDVGVLAAGIGAGVASFFMGGLAIPIIAGGSALWGLSRSTSQVVDRIKHDESMNPLTNSDARLLWLGIAANLVGFGALGATMQLSSLAVKGGHVTSAFKLVVNSLNGTSFAINTGAMVNNLVDMIEHIDRMTPADLTLQTIAIAFWAKGAFTYRTANQIVRATHGHVFDYAQIDITDVQRSEFAAYRLKINNDALLVRFLRNANTNPAQAVTIVTEFTKHNVQFQIRDGGVLVLGDGHELHVHFLQRLHPESRLRLAQLLAILDENESRDFKEMRAHVNNDIGLFAAFHRCNSKKMLQFWSIWKQHIYAHSSVSAVSSRQRSSRAMQLEFTTTGHLKIGHSNLFNVEDIGFFDATTVSLVRSALIPLTEQHSTRFAAVRSYFGDDRLLLSWMSQLSVSRQLYLNSPAQIAYSLGDIQADGLFTISTNVALLGNGPMMLNGSLRICVSRLCRMRSGERVELFGLIRAMYRGFSESTLAPPMRHTLAKCNRQRLVFEHQRHEAAAWFSGLNVPKLIASDVDDMDRLVALRHYTASALVSPQLFDNAIRFAVALRPASIGDLCLYVKFAVAKVKELSNILRITRINEYHVRGSRLKIKDWSVNAAIEELFGTDKQQSSSSSSMPPQQQQQQQQQQTQQITLLFADVMRMAESSQMWSECVIAATNLTDEQLVAAIRAEAARNALRFESPASAAYHLALHPLFDPPSGFIQRVNQLLVAGSLVNVVMSQEGTYRLAVFACDTNKFVLVVERPPGTLFIQSFF